MWHHPDVLTPGTSWQLTTVLGPGHEAGTPGRCLERWACPVRQRHRGYRYWPRSPALVEILSAFVPFLILTRTWPWGAVIPILQREQLGSEMLKSCRRKSGAR